MHCVGCDFVEAASVTAQRPCPFDPLDRHNDDEIRDARAELMTVSIEATPTEVLLKIFGSDVDESDPGKANAIYMRRWSDHKRAQSTPI